MPAGEGQGACAAQGPAGDDGARGTRALPTLLALLAFAPLAVVLWWALAGPRPEPARLDWEGLGQRIVEHGPLGAEGGRFDRVADGALAALAMAGRQRPLLGPLDEARLHADSALAAVVRTPGEDEALTEAPGLAGVLLAVGGGDGEARFELCALDTPVPAERLHEAAARAGEGVEAALGEATGRCDGGGARLLVPLTRRVTVPVDPLQRLLGRRAESTLLPAGVARVSPDGAVETAGADAGPAPVYPREVARLALLQAVPDNPAAGLGALGDPAYPVLAVDGGALWWVLPVSPAGEGDALAAFALTRADRATPGRLNPVALRWLEDPLPGPALLERRALAVLEEAGAVPADEVEGVRVWFGVPGADGSWTGRVDHAGRVRFSLVAGPDGRVCVDDLDGERVGCRG